MLNVDFIICGRVGFNVLKEFVKTHGTQAINQVVSHPDKTVINDPYEELETYCKQQSLTFSTKENYTSTQNTYQFVIGWQELLKSDGKTIILHDSLLPHYRGFAPLITSLINGEKEIGATAFIATEGYDEGPIIRQESTVIKYPITILQAMELVTALCTQLCSHVYNELQQHGKLKSYEQDHYLATYSLWRDEQDYTINWNKPSDKIKRMIDALGYPYKGAVSSINNNEISITSAEIFGDVTIENRDIGKVIFIKDNCPVVVCKEGLIKITEAYFIDGGKPVIPFSNLRSRFQ